MCIRQGRFHLPRLGDKEKTPHLTKPAFPVARHDLHRVVVAG